MESKQRRAGEGEATESANVGSRTVTKGSSTAEQGQLLRQRFNWLQRFTDEEIQHISFCEPGAKLREGETYFDISHPENGAFTANADRIVPEGGCLVGKGDVASSLWNKLIRFP